MKAAQVISKAWEVLGVEESELCCRRRNSLVRPLVARMLCKYAGLSQRQVADRMGISSGAALSQQLRRREQKAKEHEQARAQIRALDTALSKP